MRRARILVLGVVLGTGCATGGSGPAPVAPAAPPVAIQQAHSNCPFGVEHTTVAIEDTPDGVALTFGGSDPTAVADIRERIHDAAAQHGPGSGAGKGHDGRHGEGAGQHGLRSLQLPALATKADTIEGGVKLLVTPVEASDLEVVRKKLHERTAEWTAGCPR